ncbi:unnamed protein product, partial [Symbiodinium sp. CCMP2592]
MADVGRPDSPNSLQQRAQLGSPDSVKVEFDRAASPRLHRRRPFSRGGRRPARAPEPWEEMLDLVPAPPPPPVTGGVRTFDQLPSGEIQSKGNKEPVLRADWTIRRLKVDMKTVQVKYRSLLVPAGQYISSAHFRLGRQTAALRFWPNGLFGNATKKARVRMDLGGLNADSWCAIGLAMPEGTKLRFRLHVGQDLPMATDWIDGASDLDTSTTGDLGECAASLRTVSIPTASHTNTHPQTVLVTSNAETICPDAKRSERQAEDPAEGQGQHGRCEPTVDLHCHRPDSDSAWSYFAALLDAGWLLHDSSFSQIVIESSVQRAPGNIHKCVPGCKRDQHWGDRNASPVTKKSECQVISAEFDEVLSHL